MGEKIPGLAPLLRKGQILLLGEIHGTKEAPFYVQQITLNALNNDLPVTVALELPCGDQEILDQFLTSQGLSTDREKILDLPFWSQDYQDGRASEAMFQLIEFIRQLRSQNKRVQLIPIDEPLSQNREVQMARNIIAHARKNPQHLMIVLTGNYHNIIVEGSGKMGSLVLKNLGKGKVISLKLNYQNGSAWIDVDGRGAKPVRVSGDGRGDKGIHLETNHSYHGTLEVGNIHFSRPAKELLTRTPRLKCHQSGR